MPAVPAVHEEHERDEHRGSGERLDRGDETFHIERPPSGAVHTVADVTEPKLAAGCGSAEKTTRGVERDADEALAMSDSCVRTCASNATATHGNQLRPLGGPAETTAPGIQDVPAGARSGLSLASQAIYRHNTGGLVQR